MFRYEGDASYVVDSLTLFSHGRRVRGHGKLSWNPDAGFTLDAYLDPPDGGARLGGIVSTRPVAVPYSVVCFHAEGLGHGFARCAIMENPLADLASDSRGFSFRSMSLQRVRLAAALNRPRHDWSYLNVTLRTDAKPILPDLIELKESFSDDDVVRKGKHRGIRFDSPDLKLRAYPVESTLEFWWDFQSPRSVPELRRWARASALAMAAMTTQGCQLQAYSILRHARSETVYVERRAFAPVVAGRMIGSDPRIDAETYVVLATLMAERSIEGRVARNLTERVVAAFQAGYQEAKHLLIGTALEAALRSLDGKRGKPWNIQNSLKNVRERHDLPKSWNPTHQAVATAFTEIRHSTAHPHWIDAPWSQAGIEEQSDQLHHLLVLVRYFGHLIQLLAGIPVEPELGL